MGHSSENESSGLAPGALVGAGRYTLINILGRGGMGVVWLAEDSRLREKVALKFLPPEISSDSVALDDMRRETQKAHKLSHPNIVRIHDLFEAEDERPFISMEFIDGPNLSDLRLKEKSRVFTWDFLQPLTKQLCEALAYAHEEGVIHRDLKPGNMMLDSRGRLKLADFGIAAQISDSSSRVSLKNLTSGTVTHMSPQQMNGEIPAVTDDIYALGATLYELLSSKPPFYSGDIIHQVREKEASTLEQRLAELGLENPAPTEVSGLIAACLQKDAVQRPQSAGDALAWLGYVSGHKVGALTQYEIVEEESPIAEPNVGRSAPSVDEDAAFRKKAFIGAAVAGVIMLLLVFALKRDGDSPVPESPPVAGTELPEVEEVLPRAGSLDESFDPGAGPNGEVYRMIHDANGAIVICGSFEEFDGTSRPRIARLTADGALDAAFDPGKGPQGPDRNVRGLLPMPNGGVLVGGSFNSFNGVSGQFRYVRLNPDGGVDKRFKIGPQIRHPARTFEWTPDGKILAAGNWTSYNVPHRGLATIHSNGRYAPEFNPGRGLSQNEGVFELAIQPDGKILVVGWFREFMGHPFPHLVRLNSDGRIDAAFLSKGSPDSQVTALAVQPDGKILIVGLFEKVGEVPRGRIARLNADGSLDESFTVGAGFDDRVHDLALLANGKVVVVGAFKAYGSVGRNRIARLNADGSLDASFDPGEGADADVRRVIAQSDGKLLIVGKFTQYDGEERVRIARVHGGGIVNTIRPKMGRSYEVPGIGLKLGYLQPGSFNMGSNPSDNDKLKDRQPIEGPVTETTLSRGFWLGKYEVTQAEYQSLMGTNPSEHQDEATKGRLPVDKVSWHDAAEFCRRLTERERAAGRLPEGYVYALPTEAQWEFACRAGSQAEFSFGDRLSVDQANVVESYPVAGEDEYFLQKPTPVGSYPANEWGLYDMHGNVWEWTHDWFAAYPGGEATDPSGPFDGAVRTYRGGCWKYHAKFTRSARRNYLDPVTRHSDLGFRVALRPVISTSHRRASIGRMAENTIGSVITRSSSRSW